MNAHRIPRRSLLVLLALATGPSTHPARAQDRPAPTTGEVRLPLSQYAELLAAAAAPGRPGPVRHAVTRSSLSVALRPDEDRATVTASLQVRVREDSWTAVPLLPPGTAVTSVTVNGEALALVPTFEGLAWIAERAGSYEIQLQMPVTERRHPDGASLTIPVPAGAATRLDALLGGAGSDVAVVPSAGLELSPEGPSVRARATIPSTSSVLISWRTPSEAGYTLSRARYTGEVVDDAVAFEVVLGVELFGGDAQTVPLFPTSVTLRDLKADGRDASLMVAGGRFATTLRGRGSHELRLGFEVPVSRDAGPPHVDFPLLAVPVSRIELTLPGRKQLTTVPPSSVTSAERGGKTVAVTYLPLGEQVSLRWAEAVPEQVKEELRANANLYHAARAEEGVLAVQAMAHYEITRGETSQLELAVPAGVQINRVTAPDGAVADWRTSGDRGGGPTTLTVFLNRKAKGELRFDVDYERLLERGALERLPVPLLKALGAHRQRGMVALLAGQELALSPVVDTGATKVGENQLPAFVREAIQATIAHTYKYADEPPALVAKAEAPERRQGTFDAQVNTLVSIGEVSLRGSATVALNLKSGSLVELDLRLPAGLNLLGLTAPSLRKHEPREDGRLIHVEFTQEMEGQFPVELRYERILADADQDVEVPTPRVVGAQVEHGRIAVEALSAVEVKPQATEQLSSIQVGELPLQLVLKTTNPILLAYKYVHAEPPPRLVLKVTRHAALEVRAAAVDRAHYRTLVTRDGLAVTAAEFRVRNSRQQFLRIELPAAAEVWSVFVDGKAEKPALAGSEAEGKAAPRALLVKLINSTEGFPVELVYAYPLGRLGRFGRIGASLPRLDMVVTESVWDVYLPEGLSYRKPRTSMQITRQGEVLDQAALEHGLGTVARPAANPELTRPLRLAVPARGVRFAFEKLYASQTEEEAWFSIAYVSALGSWLTGSLLAAATALLWLAILRLASVIPFPGRRAAIGCLVAGALTLAWAVGFAGADPGNALLLSVAVAAGLAARAIWSRRARGQPSTS